MLIHAGNASEMFNELMGRFSGVRLAKPEDAQPLAQFINETAMSTGQLRIGFTRGDDYFALLRLQAEKFAALVCEEEGRIVGVGALTLRNSAVRGQTSPLGYFQDLRVSPAASHRTRQNFYRCFSEFVRICPQLSDFDNCALFITAILDGNSAAKSALSRQSFPLEYTRLAHYTAHLWPKPPLARRFFRNKAQPTENLSTELHQFYSEQLGRMAFDLTLGDLERIAPRAVPVTLIENDKIIAACLLVEGSDDRQLLAEQTRLKLKLKCSGTFITALRVSRTLGPERIPDIKTKLLNKALKVSLGCPGLFTGLLASENDTIDPGLFAGLLNIRTHGSLYRVFHPEHTTLPQFANGFLRPSHVPSFDWVFS